MTVEEAIFKCKCEVDFDCGTDNTEDLESIVIKALEKQIPKKPLEEKRYYGIGKCPTCNAVFMDKTTNYCGNCGQAIDWSDAE